MNNLKKRLERLEERAAPKHGPRHVLVTNVCPDPDNECTLEILPGLFAYVLGEPLTCHEVEELREKYRQEESQKGNLI
jgi:hypothetical protein